MASPGGVLQLSPYLRWGAAHGALTWGVYALVELFFSNTYPLLRQDRLMVTAWHWKLSLVLVAAYLAAGALLGGLAGLGIGSLRRRAPVELEPEDRVRIQAGALATLVLAFGANIALQTSPSKESYLSAVPILLLAAAVALVLRSPASWMRLHHAASPWAGSLLLLVPSWSAAHPFSREPPAMKLAGVSILFSILLAAAFAITKSETMSRLLANRCSLRRSAGFLAAAFAALAFLGLQLSRDLGFDYPGPGSGSGSPNVLLIVMDTVRADHLSAYGYHRDTTPRLEDLARRATLYARSVSTSERTLPSHASFFTGLYPSNHRAVTTLDSSFARPLAHDFQTLAEVLSQEGYLSSAVVANFGYLSPRFQLNQGFAHYDARRPLPVLETGHEYFLRHGMRRALELLVDTSTFDRVYRSAQEINEELFPILDRMAELDGPFFLFVNYMDAHLPHVPPQPFASRYPGRRSLITQTEIKRLKIEVLSMQREVTPEEQAHLISQYDGSIAYLDSRIGVLLDRLQDLGLFEDSLIIVTSDHGENFGHRNLFEHGCSLYQDIVHVPLIVKYPRQSVPARVDFPVSGVDLMPTILDVAGAAPAETDGRSLVREGTEDCCPVFSEFFSSNLLRMLHSRFDRFDAAVFLGRYKLIASSSGARELFDLTKDPGETEDLFEAMPEPARALEELLVQRLDALPVAAVTPADWDVDPETVDQLRSLGYVR